MSWASAWVLSVLRGLQTHTSSHRPCGGIACTLYIKFITAAAVLSDLQHHRQSARGEHKGSAAVGPLRPPRAVLWRDKSSASRGTHRRWLSAIAQRHGRRRR